jgi:hypothetical protein
MRNEQLAMYNDSRVTFSEYPVISVNSEQVIMNNGAVVDPILYRVIPDCGTDYNFPYSIEFSPAIRKWRNLLYLQVVYWAGYGAKEERGMRKEESICVPADLQAACFELAAWNLNRYRGRRIGMTGIIRGSGRDGEHFELAMPENVRVLLEPYRRRVI